MKALIMMQSVLDDGTVKLEYVQDVEHGEGGTIDGVSGTSDRYRACAFDVDADRAVLSGAIDLLMGEQPHRDGFTLGVKLVYL